MRLKQPASGAHPAVHFLFLRLRAMGKSRHWLAGTAKLGRSTLRGWWDAKRSPKQRELDRAIAAVGGETIYRVVT